jgi:hypothetical protein
MTRMRTGRKFAILAPWISAYAIFYFIVQVRASGLDSEMSHGSNASENNLNKDTTNSIVNIADPKYRADPTGANDSGPAINNAIAAAGNGSVQLPIGTYLIDNPVNLTGKTGNRFIGPQSQSNLSLGGQATLICNTGSKPCIDMTGSNGVSIEHLVLKSGSSSPSCIGILQARNSSAGGIAQQNVLDNVTVIFATGRTSCNAGKGTIGVYNYAAELSDYLNVYLQTDTPVVFSSQNKLGITSPYQTIATGAKSMTEVAFSGVPTIVSTAGPNIWIDGSLGHFDLGSSYLLGCASARCETSAILINGALNFFQWHGRLENNGGTRIPFELGGSSYLQNADIDAVLDGGNGPAFRYDDAAGANCPIMESSVLRIENDALSGSTNLISESGSGCTAVSSEMIAVDIPSTLAGYSYLTITQGATGGSVTTEGLNPSNVSLPAGYHYHNDSYFGNLNNGTIQTYDNQVSQQKALTTSPVALSSLPSCTSGTEGTIGRANNCSSCVGHAGTACSGRGSTHCEVVCNGTNYVQEGY